MSFKIPATYKEFEDLLIQATNTANDGITISAMKLEDEPLIFINDGFERLTGYSKEYVLGKNCRFLQGPDTDQKAVNELRRAIKAGEQTTVELLNYKKDGTPFWNRLSITPLKDKTGEITHYVGIQSDITELRETQQELLDANKVLATFKEQINFELDQAKKAQSFIFPASFPDSKKVKFSAVFEPMGQIGGDLYDVFEISKGVFGILIADVTGHGIPAALLTFMTSFAFKSSLLQSTSPAEVVTTTNDRLYNRMPEGSFVTMLFAIYDSNNRELTYTQAGHPEGYIIRPGLNKLVPLTSEGTLVGAVKTDSVKFGESKIQMEVGDKLVLYTDAILEVRDENDEMISNDLFTSFLVKNAEKPIDDLLPAIREFGLNYSKNKAFDDDFTMVGLEVLE